MLPAAVVNDADGDGQRQDRHGQVKDDRARINQPGGKAVQMFRAGHVVENPRCGEFPPYHGNKPHEENQHQQTDGDDAGNDLAARQGRGENADGREPGADQQQDGVRPGPVRQAVGEDHARIIPVNPLHDQVGPVRQKGVQQHGQPQDDVKGVCGEIFAQDYLPCLDGRGQQGFQRSCLLFLRQGTHGKQRENEQEIKPEHGGMQDEEQNAFLLRGQLERLQRAGQGNALQGHDEGQDDPSVRGHHVASEFFSENGKYRRHGEKRKMRGGG